MNRPLEDDGKESDTDPSEFAGEAKPELQPSPEQRAFQTFLETKGFKSKIIHGLREITLQRGDEEIITVFEFRNFLIIGVFGFPDKQSLATLLRSESLSYRIDGFLGHGEKGYYYKIASTPVNL